MYSLCYAILQGLLTQPPNPLFTNPYMFEIFGAKIQKLIEKRETNEKQTRNKNADNNNKSSENIVTIRKTKRNRNPLYINTLTNKYPPYFINLYLHTLKPRKFKVS